MRRIYFLVPNIETTHKIVDEIRSLGIDDRYIHVLAKRGTPLEEMPEATVMQKTDFIPAIERGLALGATNGLLAGLVTLSFSGIVVGGGVLLGLIVAGAGVGSWAGGLIGLNAGNSRLKQYEDAIENGELLVLLDLPKEQIDEISRAITRHHPKAEFEGVEPILPPSY